MPKYRELLSRINLNAVGPAALALSRIVIQICGLLILIVGARILEQDELGVFALISSAIILATKVAEAGWCELVTSAPPGSAPRSTIFWSAILSGFFMSVIYLIAGLIIESIWPLGNNAWHIYFLLISTILPSTISSCQFGVLIRSGRLGMLAFIQAIAEVAGACVGIWALMHDQRIFSLAYARVTTSLVTVAMAALFVRWLPSLTMNKQEFIKDYKYSFSLISARVIGFTTSYGAEFIIGAFLGLKEVGIYRIASRISGAVAEVCYEPLRVLGWRVISRTTGHDSKQSLANAFETIFAFSLFVCLPIFIGLSLTSSNLLSLILGRSDWLAAAPLVGLLAISKLFGTMTLFSESSLTVVHKGHLIPRIALFSMITTMSVTVIAGLLFPTSISIAWAQLVSAAIICTVLGWTLQKHIPWRILSIYKSIKSSLIAGAMMGAALFFILKGSHQFKVESDSLIMIICVGAAAPIYLMIAGLQPWKNLLSLLNSKNPTYQNTNS